MPDIITTQIFSDGEKGITATKMNNIVANSVIQPDFVTAKPSSSTLDPTDQLLEVKGAGTYARITGQQLIDSVSASVTQNIQPTIWSVRLRSFNAIGNPTFEVDQRNVGNALSNPASGFLVDRWNMSKTALTAVINTQQTASAGGVNVPGTSFCISRNQLYLTFTTGQTSLAAGDYYVVSQSVEGPQLRELINDVHSVSILVNSSVTPLKFGLFIRDPGLTRTLVKLCTVTAAGWQLIPLPNLPLWASGGSWSVVPGTQGYNIGICLAAGTTQIAPAADTWQNGNYLGCPGQDNWFSKPVNSTIMFAYVGHEPGAQCTTPMDCSFGQNLDGDFGCLRYLSKTYGYNINRGTVDGNGTLAFVNPYVNYGVINIAVPFPKVMAKTPTVTTYSPATGAANVVRDLSNGADRTVTSILTPNDRAYSGLNISGQITTGNPLYTWHHTADTGW